MSYRPLNLDGECVTKFHGVRSKKAELTGLQVRVTLLNTPYD